MFSSFCRDVKACHGLGLGLASGQFFAALALTLALDLTVPALALALRVPALDLALRVPALALALWVLALLI
jgi:hypothetical protein